MQVELPDILPGESVDVGLLINGIMDDSRFDK